jgi:acyl-CoA synthetase (NDP forming)
MSEKRRDLTPLFRPRSVAVIGASDDASKIRGRILAQLVKGGFEGRILPINPSRPVIQGLVAFPSVAAAPGPIDLAMIAIPAASVPATLRECAASGVRAALVFSAGFAEEGGESAALQDEVRAIARETGMVVAGPNSVGMLDVEARVAATFSPSIDFAALEAMRARAAVGRIGIISQSGGLGFAIYQRGLRRQLSFSYVVNSGNEADLDATELAEFMVEDPSTKAVLFFLESIRRGRRFATLAERALELGKPLIVAKVGRSAAGSRAAASHTASMTGEDAVYDSVFRRYGVIRVDDIEEMLDVAAAAVSAPLPKGRRVGVVTISGGVGGWLSDTLESAGLEVPHFSPALQARIREFLPSYGSAFNPVDITAQAIENNHRLLAVETLARADEVDAVVVVNSLASDNRLALEKDGLKRAIAEAAKPVLFYSYPLPSEAAQATLGEIGVPCYTALAGPARAIRALGDLRAARERRHGAPEAAPEGARAHALAVLDRAGPVLAEHEAKAVLRAYGVALPPERLTQSRDEAEAAAASLGYPVALKIQSGDIPHKTDAGGVALGLADAASVRRAYDAILESVRARHPDAKLDGVLVQPMARPGFETIAGALVDDNFGPQVLVGIGGIAVEILKDTAMAPAPLGAAGAAELIARLHGAKLLGPVRGRPPRDVAALARLVAQLSLIAADLADRVAEIDLNPVLVHDDGAGATVLDALIVQRATQGTTR